MNAPMDVPTAIVIGVVTAAYTVAYYTPRTVAAIRVWRERRRHQQYGRYVDELVNTAILTGLVPPEDEPDLFEESRPVDLDECSRCDGQGMYLLVDDEDRGYVLCRSCLGSGQTAPRGGVWIR